MAEIKQILVVIVSLLVVSTWLPVSLYVNCHQRSEKPPMLPYTNEEIPERYQGRKNEEPKRTQPWLEVSATSDDSTHNIFIEFLEKEISKDGWKKLEDSFKEKTGKHYTKQLENHWDLMQKEWKLFKTLMRGETGLRWDATKNMFVADDSWWNWKQKIANNKAYKKFKGRDLSLFWFRYDGLFSDIAATCFHVPASTQVNITELVGDEDVCVGEHGGGYDNTCLWIETSNNPNNFEPSFSNKRKRKEGVCSETESKKPKTGPQMDQITATTIVASDGPTIKNCLDVLHALPRDALTPSVRYYAASLFSEKYMREIFIGQPTNEERIGWLQYHYNKCN